MMQMNRQWMNADRRSPEYIAGMQAFLEVAKANKNPKGLMCCPCCLCRNDKDYSDWGTLHLHLIKTDSWQTMCFGPGTVKEGL
jgi:hypothetical protein